MFLTDYSKQADLMLLCPEKQEKGMCCCEDRSAGHVGYATNESLGSGCYCFVRMKRAWKRKRKHFSEEHAILFRGELEKRGNIEVEIEMDLIISL